MTCIVGLVKDGITYMGGDSFGSNGCMGIVYKNRKVFKLKDKDDMLCGFTGSFRMGQLLQYSDGLIEELALIKNKINDEYMVNKFISNVRRLFSDGGFEKDNKGGNFLISFKDKLYEVQNDYSILEPAKGYAAIGSGEDFANASLYTTESLELSPEERITKALEAAENFSKGVRRPFYIINSANDTVLEIK